MTENNLLREVQEDYDRQRLEAFAKKYGAYFLAAALLLVLGTASYASWQSWNQGREQKATGALWDVLNAKDLKPTQQIDALTNFAAQKKDRETQATLARLHAAALAAQEGDTTKAVQVYDALANDTNADATFRQLADLMAVYAQMDSGDSAKLQGRLTPLMADKAPWRYSAMELAGYLALRDGNKDVAKKYFTELAQNADVPRSLASRAEDMLRYVSE